MPITTRIDKDELKEALQFLRNGLTKTERTKLDIQLELELYKNRGVARVRGADYEIAATSTTYGKVALPLLMLWEVMKSQKKKVLEFTFSDHELLTDTGVNITSSRIQLVHTEDTVTPELPLNFDYRHLMQLSLDFDAVKLEQMGMMHEVNKAEYELEKAVDRVAKILNRFNIPKQEIEYFIRKQLIS